MKTLILVATLAAIACNDDCPRCFSQSITSYSYRPNRTTPAGYRIDTNGQDVDLEAIDSIIEETTLCFADYPEFEPPDPGCLKIVIADDWFRPADNEDIQIFPCDLPGAQGCAGVIQNNQIIIVPPDLRALSHELMHVQTGEGDLFLASLPACGPNPGQN